MVLATARRHGHGIIRLPDRSDRGKAVAALQVETDEQAEQVFSALDSSGRRFFVDAELKQDLHLLDVAADILVTSSYMPIKPNDTTVDAYQSVLNHTFGPNLAGLSVGIYGTGNLAMKFALRVAELGCKVVLTGRDPRKVDTLIRAINTVLPAYTPSQVSSQIPGDGLKVLASAVTAEQVVGDDWVPRLNAGGSLCIDVGINNFSPGFIEAALSAGHRCMRLDVRSAGDPLPPLPNSFFDNVLGRDVVGGVPVIAGGYMGRRGEVVVDRIVAPTRPVGIANGTGGLVSEDQWTAEDRQLMERVLQTIAGA